MNGIKVDTNGEKRIEAMTNDTAEGSVAQLILGLENKDTRLICAMSLCLGGQKKHIQTVISSMDKMI